MDKEAILKQLQKCKNIGPTCAEHLYRAGIYDQKTMIKLGTEEVFFQIWKAKPTISIHPCYLYALEGAITDTPFRDVPLKRREAFKKFCKDLKSSL